MTQADKNQARRPVRSALWSEIGPSDTPEYSYQTPAAQRSFQVTSPPPQPPKPKAISKD